MRYELLSQARICTHVFHNKNSPRAGIRGLFQHRDANGLALDGIWATLLKLHRQMGESDYVTYCFNNNVSQALTLSHNYGASCLFVFK